MNWFIVLLTILTFLFGYRIGWISAHSEVARECERLGSFYVGDRVFICTVKLREKQK